MKRILCVALLLLVLLQCFCSCATQNKYTAYSFDYFDTFTEITGYETSKEKFDEVSSYIMAQLEEYHRLFDIYNEYEGKNNLYTVNSIEDGKHEAVKVDGRIIDMLLFAKDMCVKSEGKVNVAMGSVLKIWHQYREAGIAEPKDAKLPPIELLRTAAKHTDIDSVVINIEDGTVYISDPECFLDVGAVAKGYAVEKIAEELENQGITGYVINVGGNVRTIGMRGDKKTWRVGIEAPEGFEESYLAMTELSGESLVTSGNYQRYYTVDEKNYHHIIDPETLMPSDRYISVSVIAKDSALADTLSTALFSMGVEEGKKLLEGFNDVFVMWVHIDKEIEYSDGFLKYTESN